MILEKDGKVIELGDNDTLKVNGREMRANSMVDRPHFARLKLSPLKDSDIDG